MTQKPLYRSLDANLALLEEMFGRSDDFYTKRLMLAGIPCAIVMFTGLSSPEKLCHMALDMLDRDPAMLGGGEGLCDYLLTQSRVPAEPDAVEDRTALVELLSNGLSVLLIDGVRRGVAFSTQEMPQRSISTPMSEGNLRGPQEAFTELLRNNISLLRRQFRTGTLVAEISTARTPCQDRILSVLRQYPGPKGNHRRSAGASGAGGNSRSAGQRLLCVVPQAGQAESFPGSCLHRTPRHGLCPPV